MKAKIDVGCIHVTCAQDIRELGFCNMEYIEIKGISNQSCLPQSPGSHLLIQPIM